MRFTLDQLRALLAVAETGGVRRAAERLHLTQPAITARIKKLETSLGVELFDRSQAMKPTKSGVALVAAEGAGGAGGGGSGASSE